MLRLSEVTFISENTTILIIEKGIKRFYNFQQDSLVTLQYIP